MERVLIIIMTLFCLAFNQVDAQNTGNKKVAILETVDKDDVVPYGVKLMVRSKLAYAVTNTPGYEGYDRVDVSAILGEHEFQRTGLVSDSQIKRLGEMTGADYILIAEVAKFDESNIIITAKILDVESAKLDKSADIQTTMDILAMEKNCNILAAKLLSKKDLDNNLLIREEEIFTAVEIMPEFPGGEAELMKWLGNHIKYPPMAAKNNIQGQVVVRFVVKKDGSIGQVIIARSKDNDLDAEAIRVVKLMPRWKPGLMNGTPVNVWYTLPISFKLQHK